MNIKPIVVAIWCGENKPSDLNAFLSRFVTEMKVLIENGLYINGFHMKILLRACICDTPARSFIKGIYVSHMQ